MFLKLIKHEFKSQAGLLGILSGAAMLVGVFGALMMWLFVKNITDTEPMMWLLVITYLMMLGTFVIIMAYYYAVNILLVVRFYRRHFSDEGYLTFTLPASSHQILMSGVLNNAVWSTIAVAVTIAACSLVIVPMMVMMMVMVSGQVPDMTFFEIVREIVQEMKTDGVFIGMFDGMLNYVFMFAVLMFSSWVGNLILPLLSVTIGSVAVKRFKLLAGFGIYYGMEMILSFVVAIVTIFGEVGVFLAYDSMGTHNSAMFMLLPAALYLLVGIGGYFLMHRLVDRKLNLP